MKQLGAVLFGLLTGIAAGVAYIVLTPLFLYVGVRAWLWYQSHFGQGGGGLGAVTFYDVNHIFVAILVGFMGGVWWKWRRLAVSARQGP